MLLTRAGSFVLEAQFLTVAIIACLDVQTKKAAESINSRLALVMKSGKYSLGYKTALKTLRSGKGEQGTQGSQAASMYHDDLHRSLPTIAVCCLLYLSSQAGHHLQQHPTCAQVRAGVLRYAFQDWRAPLLRQ